MPTNTSVSRSATAVTGCLAPCGVRSQGSVTSTASSSRTRWSRSASSSRLPGGQRVPDRGAGRAHPAAGVGPGGRGQGLDLGVGLGDGRPVTGVRQPRRLQLVEVLAAGNGGQGLVDGALHLLGGQRRHRDRVVALVRCGHCGFLISCVVPVDMDCGPVDHTHRLARTGRAVRPAAAAADQVMRARARRSAKFRRAGGHGKSELRPAAGRLVHADGPAVRLDQALDDEQAKARTAAPLGPPELAEHPRGQLGRDASALVADGHRDPRGPGATQRFHHGGYGTSPVPDRVLDQVSQDLVDLVRVQPGLRQFAGHLQLEPGRVLARRRPGRR